MKKEFIYFMAGITLSTCVFSMFCIDLSLRLEEVTKEAYKDGFSEHRNICNIIHSPY